jgi:peptidoglycan/LPS O-acetylase OafA/YrhL
MPGSPNPTPSSSGVEQAFSAKRGEIDGLRAIAVVLVLLYHAKFGFTGGYVGVDVFIVISGFLVTSLLLREIDLHNHIALGQFWGRRIRRVILPVSLVTVATVAFGYLTLEPFRLRSLAYDALAAATMNANNWYALTTNDYLSGLALPSPLQHLWSLGVEEQFYLVLPLLAVATLRFSRQRLAFISLIIICTFFSLLASLYLTESSPAAAYYLLPTRAWELLAGSLLALAAQRAARIPAFLRSIFGWLGLIVIIYTAVKFNENTSFPGYAALLPVLGTVGVLIAADLGSGRILALPLLRWLGVRSYSIYLWHWPVLILSEAQIGPLSSTQRATALFISLILGDITFRFVEQPFRFHPHLVRDWAASFRAGAALTAAVTSSALILLFISPTNINHETGVALSTETTVNNQLLSTNLPRISNNSANEVKKSENLTLTVITELYDADLKKIQPSQPASPSITPSDLPKTNQKLPLKSNLPVKTINDPIGKVLLLGDSTLAPLRWFRQGTASLSGFTYQLEAESCRRLALKSCKGREERTPISAAPLVDKFTSNGQRFQTAVVMGGYHSTPSSIGEEFVMIVDALRANGTTRILFLEFRESLAYPAAGSRGKKSVYTLFNKTVRSILSSGSYPDVILLPWNTYSATQSHWFRTDGIHVNLEGALALGAYLSDTLAYIEEKPCLLIETAEPCNHPTFPTKVDYFERYSVTPSDIHCYQYGASRRETCEPDKGM